MESKSLREPIVCVLGHVDHGKTTLLDAIRGTNVAGAEEGGITQRIGATEIPKTIIEKFSKDVLGTVSVSIPGLLFIDTPGHVAFANMRGRGGALADIALLVVDINEGFMPQTVESINILKKFKTPFIVVANKIDRIPMFVNCPGKSFRDCFKMQREEWVVEFEKRLYNLVSKLYEFGFSSERYDRIKDFKKNLVIVPASAKESVGLQDIIVMLTGLAQRFLESEISLKVSDQGVGTVLEVKREDSMGLTVDTILYQGKLRKGDVVALNTKSGPSTTRVKGLYVAVGRGGKSLQEKKEINAAAAIRILLANKIDVIPGTPIYSVRSGDDIDEIFNEIQKATQPDIDISENGIIVKADSLGSLEAISYELSLENIKVRQADIGDISKRDIISAETLNDPTERLIVGFNVEVLPEAKDTLASSDVDVITDRIIYNLVEKTKEWIESKRRALLEEKKREIPIPSKVMIMPEYIFRTTKPVIVGLKVISGRLKVGDRLIKSDGRFGGTIKSLRDGDVSKQFFDAPGEVAAAIEGVTLNRQISPGEFLYVDIPESAVPSIRNSDMGPEIMETLDEIIRIKRKENIFWGTGV